MKNSVKILSAAIVLTMAMFVTTPLQAIGGGDRCPPYVGKFHMAGSSLNVTIARRADKAVTPPQTEELANPPESAVAEALAKRGSVEFEAHVDADSGHLFIHWESVRPIK